MTGNIATRIEMLSPSELILAPALQARVEMSDDVVDDYAEAMMAGAEFPPVKVIRVLHAPVGGVAGPHLVDGWHRHLAHRHARPHEDIACEVRDGTWTDALLEAARANSAHGLRRSQDDKRRAVQLLLREGDYCGMSNRSIAELAAVSHTFVAGVRKHYGLVAGERLTAERVAFVDNPPEAQWAKILDEAYSWQKDKIEAVRVARDPRELVKAAEKLGGVYNQNTGKTDPHPATLLRRADLKVATPWRWTDDETTSDRVTRAGELDEIDEIESALQSVECPESVVDELYRVLGLALRIQSLNNTWEFAAYEKAFSNRPRLLELLNRRAEKLKAANSDSSREEPWAKANKIHDIKDAEKQAKAVEKAAADVLSYVRPRELLLQVREGAFKARVGSDGPCASPFCKGWVRSRDEEQRVGGNCVICGRHPDQWREQAQGQLKDASRLLRVPGFAVWAGSVLLDAPSITALRELEAAGPGDWMQGLPADAAVALREWFDRPVPEGAVDPDAKVDEKPVEPGQEVDHDDDLPDDGEDDWVDPGNGEVDAS